MTNFTVVIVTILDRESCQINTHVFAYATFRRRYMYMARLKHIFNTWFHKADDTHYSA